MAKITLEALTDKSMKRIGNVNSHVKGCAKEIIKQAYVKNIYVVFAQGLRTFAEQDALYAQGRTKPGNIVTNARGGQSIHNYGLALDFYLTNDQGTTASWEVNNDWKEVVKIAKSLGADWGGDWVSFRDYPHFEWTGGLTYNQIFAGKKPTFKSTITKASNPITTVKNSTSTKVSNNITLVDYLDSKNVNSSFTNRQRLAKKYGIKNYTGTAGQNIQLLEILKKSNTTESRQVKPKDEYYTTNPGKVKLLTKCNLYTSVEFNKNALSGLSYPKGEVFTVKEVKYSKSGTPRLIVSNGKYVLTANKSLVKKI